MNSQNKIILITGATSGIGLSLTEIYLKDGWTVIGIGRKITLLKSLRDLYLEKLIISASDEKNGKLKVVDIGCGHASAYESIRKLGVNFDYTGIELRKDFSGMAIEK